MKFTRILIQSSFILISCILPLTFANERSENDMKNEITLEIDYIKAYRK